MTTYSVRCRHRACRVRVVSKQHPDDMQAVKCAACGHTKGWRYEARDYNRRNLCTCGGPEMGQRNGERFPHNRSHPLCDFHPQGFYNQAKARGIPDDEIDIEHRPEAPDECPF